MEIFKLGNRREHEISKNEENCGLMKTCVVFGRGDGDGRGGRRVGADEAERRAGVVSHVVGVERHDELARV